ncbi:hypothetical protein K469DRAFT_686123 [Zopfia rhizophila CBS 207.26]|uniref:Uncharacterized protein n=1 Tax=Zopfia rhizophila CBS 207.26 TaxID=1314779 RepID=A0A6A6EAL9_9PEZI|nr:hypothetical protein K469DRAFT_686123 [Zopfia rhizophila CBS 207.26]
MMGKEAVLSSTPTNYVASGIKGKPSLKRPRDPRVLDLYIVQRKKPRTEYREASLATNKMIEAALARPSSSEAMAIKFHRARLLNINWRKIIQETKIVVRISNQFHLMALNEWTMNDWPEKRRPAQKRALEAVWCDLEWFTPSFSTQGSNIRIEPGIEDYPSLEASAAWKEELAYHQGYPVESRRINKAAMCNAIGNDDGIMDRVKMEFLD